MVLRKFAQRFLAIFDAGHRPYLVQPIGLNQRIAFGAHLGRDLLGEYFRYFHGGAFLLKKRLNVNQAFPDCSIRNPT